MTNFFIAGTTEQRVDEVEDGKNVNTDVSRCSNDDDIEEEGSFIPNLRRIYIVSLVVTCVTF